MRKNFGGKKPVLLDTQEGDKNISSFRNLVMGKRKRLQSKVFRMKKGSSYKMRDMKLMRLSILSEAIHSRGGG